MAPHRSLSILLILAGLAGARDLAVTNSSVESPAAFADSPYSIRSLPVPEGVVTEAGGLAYWPDGSLVFCTRRGDIWTIRDGRWNLFASGLLEPLGIWTNTVGEVHVTHSQELTRIIDTNGDLSADRFETVTAGWEIPGATADFVYGLCRDRDGNLYGTMHTTHGPWAAKSLPPGVTLKKGQLHARNSINNFGGPMGAPVIGRGWSFQVAPSGKLTWWSSGLRAPNGVGFNAAGDLFATDNQGDWVGTSAMHHIEQGDFHGHPSSYFWDPKRTLDMDLPLDQLAVALDKIRKRPAVLFPHGILGNSPSQPVLAPADGSFGPFAGQFFVGDNVAPLLSRVYLEKVDGEYQGACFPFIRDRGLHKALCRMVFSPEGKLMIAFGCRGWGPATTGLQEVAWSGETPFEMQKINLQRDGFKITFTKPLAEQDLTKAFAIQSYRYKYHHLYGSPQVDVKQIACSGISLSADRRVVTLRTPQLETGKIYEFQLAGVTAADGTTLANAEAYYTLNQLPTKPSQTSTAKRDFFPICMSHFDARKRSLDEQAALYRELGYPGCAHLCQEFGYPGFGYPKDMTVAQRAASLEKQGLRLKVAFVRIRVDAPQPIDLEKLKAAMPVLEAHQSMLGVLLLGDRTADLDDQAVAVLTRMADLAESHGVKMAIYPHTGDYTQTVAQSLRVARKVNRPERLGVMFNLYHWMHVERDRDLTTVLTEARPWLKLVNINGSSKDKAEVLPLDQGDFPVEELLGILREIDYRGPVGLMCWGIGGDARNHLAASMKQWKSWNPVVHLQRDGNGCRFETATLKGRIGEGRFIGLNQVIHTPSGTVISGNGGANRHGLLTLYRVFTRDHRHGSAAYDWPEREISIDGDTVVMRWPATATRPFDLQARYAFPAPDQVDLAVTVRALEQLEDFEVQIGSYFDGAFPNAGVRTGGDGFASSPKQLGTWHAFPRDKRATAIIGDGRWRHGPSPVEFAMREQFASPLSIRRHADHGLTAVLKAAPEDCFAIYTAHDGEAHFSNYNALFGHTIAAGESATARLSLTLGTWTDEQIVEAQGAR